MVDHMIRTWEVKTGKKIQIRKKLKEEKSLEAHLNGNREDF